MKTFFALATLAVVASADGHMSKTDFVIVPEANAIHSTKIWTAGSHHTMVDKDGRLCFMLDAFVNFTQASEKFIYQWIGQLSAAGATDYSEQVNLNFLTKGDAFAGSYPQVHQSCGDQPISTTKAGGPNSAERRNANSGENCSPFSPVDNGDVLTTTQISSSYMRLFETPKSKLPLKGGAQLSFKGAINVYSASKPNNGYGLQAVSEAIELTVADAAVYGLASAGAMAAAVASLLAF